jgi:RNA-directed DNA polymerase
VVSPLLSNLYLDPLDWRMAETGYQMVRYADDSAPRRRGKGAATAA